MPPATLIDKERDHIPKRNLLLRYIASLGQITIFEYPINPGEGLPIHLGVRVSDGENRIQGGRSSVGRPRFPQAATNGAANVACLTARHQRTDESYCQYYHRSRTHLALSKEAPEPRAKQPPDLGAVIEITEVGGLDHPREINVEVEDRKWVADIEKIMTQCPIPTPSKPSDHTFFVATNFAWHYHGRNAASVSEGMLRVEEYSRHPLNDPRTYDGFAR